MSNYSIKIPDIGEGITEVELVEWFVGVGDWVAEDQNVVSVMTEKVSVEITSPVKGRVISMGGRAGDVMAVGAELILIDLGADSSALPEKVAELPDKEPVSEPNPEVLKVESPSMQEVPVTPIPESLVVEPSMTEAASVSLVSSPHERLLQKVQASPAVRKRAADLDINLQDLASQLGKNQLTHADLDQQITGSTATRSPDTLSGQIDTIPIVGVRRQIAKKMQESMQTIPHFSYVESIDVTQLEQWRQQLNQRWANERGHLTLLPFLVRAMCLAIVEHPQVNARYNAETNQLEQYSDVHVAIATQTNEGLRVPVLESAQHKDFWHLAREIRMLAAQAHSGGGSLTAKSSITLSSLGALGGIVATPIINAPEVAIVGVNKQSQQPVVIDGQIQIRTLMNLSSSFDHRFIDGFYAAQFIQTVKRMLETPQVYLIQ